MINKERRKVSDNLPKMSFLPAIFHLFLLKQKKKIIGDFKDAFRLFCPLSKIKLTYSIFEVWEK